MREERNRRLQSQWLVNLLVKVRVLGSKQTTDNAMGHYQTPSISMAGDRASESMGFWVHTDSRQSHGMQPNSFNLKGR